MKEKILITGVAGFIGSHISERFLSHGYHVVGIDDFSTGKRENIPSGVDFIEGDLASTDIFKIIPTDCCKILHLAGQSSGEISFDDPVSDLRRNTISTLNLIRYGILNKVERLVYASSMSVYGSTGEDAILEEAGCQPLSCYGISKLASEQYLRTYQNQLPYVSLRMFNVYGPGQDLDNLRQGMVSIYLSQAIRSKKIHVKGSLDRFRDFIYIDDVVEAWFRASTYKSALNQTINVGTGIKTTVKMLLNKICNLVPESSYNNEGFTPGDQAGIFPNINSLSDILGLNKFTGLDIGLGKFIKWAEKNTNI
jgi:UDP-glucose 4-epimerase